MRLLKIAVPIAALVAAIFILYSTVFSGSDSGSGSIADHKGSPADVDKLIDTNLDTQNAGTSPKIKLDNTPPEKPVLLNGEDISNAIGSDAIGSDSTVNSQPDYPALMGYEVGLTDLSDEEYLALVDRLRNDPALLADVLNELRAETDPARLKRLTTMLGATGSADVLPVAEELVYSSSPDSRKIGLDLLSRVAPQNPAAYDIANSILGSEADPKVLVSTMNVLARPANAGPEARATAISQAMPLANHESAAVRSHSVGVYAYADYPFQTREAVERLMEIAEDTAEKRGVRRGAIFALSKMSPDEITTERLNAAKKQMREARQSSQ